MILQKEKVRNRGLKNAAVFEDVELQDCTFDVCTVDWQKDPTKRFVFRRVKAKNCTVSAVQLGNPILEDCLIDGLRVEGKEFRVYGALWKHVTLQGEFDSIFLAAENGDGIQPDLYERIRASTDEFYRQVDWALDIKNISTKAMVVRGIPLGLIRWNPESQFIIRRLRLQENDAWRQLVTPDGFIDQTCRGFLLGPLSEALIVLGIRAATFEQDQMEMKRLRENGYVD